MGALYRAIFFGTLPGGRAVREGGIIREEELEGRKPGLWMEEIKGAEAPEAAPSPAPDEAPEKDEAKSEAAPVAESKRKGRKGG